jgi:LacI family transcriptional regulator
MATIKEIAHMAGVSRGTVDRVLNNRGSVNPQTARKIREIASALNYSPNLAGKTLAVRKKQLKFGYILFGSTSSNPFFLDVVRGIETRAAELREYGVSVEIRYAEIGNPDSQVKLINELAAAGIDGLAITPINHPAVAEQIKSLAAKGLPVVTVNSDIPDSGRLAYVGSDYFRSGQTAAGLMNLICGGSANVGVIIGSPRVLCHSERVEGFRRRIGEAYPGIRIAGACVNNDDDLDSFSVTQRLLMQNPEIDALFLAAAGVAGACRAVEKSGLAGKIKMVSYDTTPTTRELLRRGVIVATISQQPFTQGAKPLDILLDCAGMGIRPEKEFYYTKIEIKICENL